MLDFSPEFTAHIEREVTTLCWLWRLTRRDGAVLGFTDHDGDLVHDNVIYHAASAFSPADIDTRLGFGIDNSEVQGLLSHDKIRSADVKAGLYDGCAVTIIRANWINPSEQVIYWRGNFGEITVTDDVLSAELLGESARLERSTGRVFSRQCSAVFGDANCGLDVRGFAPGTICPRTFAACRDQFSNAVNFQGFPYMIGEDASYAGPEDGTHKDGGSRYQ